MRPLERCANGCDRPPCPPSLVICRECQDRITEKLRVMAGPEPDPCQTAEERNAKYGPEAEETT